MTLADLGWVVEDVRRRLPDYQLAADYDEGRHRLLFATEKYKNTFGDLFREFADNMCDDVLDAITDRLQINGWTSPDPGLASLVDTVWTANRGESRAGGVHRNGFREGDGFVMVQVDETNTPRWWKQRPGQMAVRYSTDSPDQVELGGKVWKSGKRYRANLYYPDGLVERYATRGLGTDGGLPKGAAFRPLVAGDPDLEAAGVESAYDATDVEGVPIFHYPNGTVSEYGRSLLRPVIPLQDALNKSVTDMLVAMEFHAYPQRWATGVEVQRDPVTNQELSPFASGEGRLWRVGKEGARFGQFDPAGMEGFLSVQDAFRLEIARKGGMPGHQVNLRSGGGNITSGIGLLVMEGRAIKMARDRQRDWGYQHRESMAYGLRLIGRTEVTAEDLGLEWAPAETRDELAFWEMAALKRDLGVPLRQILIEGGYDTDEVDEFLADREAATEAEELARDALNGGRRNLTVGQGSSIGVPAPPAGADQSGVPA